MIDRSHDQIVMEFEAHSIQAFSNHNDVELNGFFTPTKNETNEHTRTLQELIQD